MRGSPLRKITHAEFRPFTRFLLQPCLCGASKRASAGGCGVCACDHRARVRAREPPAHRAAGADKALDGVGDGLGGVACSLVHRDQNNRRDGRGRGGAGRAGGGGRGLGGIAGVSER